MTLMVGIYNSIAVNRIMQRRFLHPEVCR